MAVLVHKYMNITELEARIKKKTINFMSFLSLVSTVFADRELKTFDNYRTNII